MTFKIPNGESNEEFLDRLRNFLNDIIKHDEDILIVCHAGSINGMISILTNEPFDEMVKKLLGENKIWLPIHYRVKNMKL